MRPKTAIYLVGKPMDTFQRGRISPSAVISDDAEIGQRVTVGAFSIVHPGVRLGDDVVVGSHCVLGEPTADFYEGDGEPEPLPCSIGDGSVIRSHAVIYQGVTAGAGLRTGHRVTIREGSTLGEDVQIGTLADLQGDLTIGSHARLHSSVHVGRLSTVEEFTWIFPFVVLTNDPHPPSDTCTVGAIIRRYAVVATNSIVMPGVQVGEHALVGAMSLVTHDVERETVVVGVPAKPIGSVHDVQCRHGALEHVYPWPLQFRRGYPEGALPPPEAFVPLGHE
jgi:acetyltransferase-like isoleucine patch superfamily enzyme